MKIIEKYTGDKTYMFPNGRLATKEVVLAQYPAALTFTHVIETDENHEIIWAFNNLSALKSLYNIDSSLSEEESIQKLQEISNYVPEVDITPSAEERMAAAMEFQNLMTLSNVGA